MASGTREAEAQKRRLEVRTDGTEMSDFIWEGREANSLEDNHPHTVLKGPKFAPYNPSNPDCIAKAIQLLELKFGDVVYDLGCGDGRFLLEAYRLFGDGLSYRGVEYDERIFMRAIANLTENNAMDKISVVHENVLNIDFSDATALFIYLVPDGIRSLRDKLIDLLNKGCRIVSYVFSIPDIHPTEVVLYKGSTKLYLYRKVE